MISHLPKAITNQFGINSNYKYKTLFYDKLKWGKNERESTSGKLHKMPQVTYNLEPICGNVAVTGDLTRPN